MDDEWTTVVKKKGVKKVGGSAETDNPKAALEHRAAPAPPAHVSRPTFSRPRADQRTTVSTSAAFLSHPVLQRLAPPDDVVVESPGTRVQGDTYYRVSRRWMK